MKNPKLQDHLYSLEERLLHPDRESDRANLEPLFAADYKEFCSSGRVFNRRQTIDVLLKSEPRPATIHHFYVDQLTETVALATYRATTSVAVSHRSSLWVLRATRGQLHSHQGPIAT